VSVLGELAFFVNDDFDKPLNQQIKDMIGVTADESQIYTQQSLGVASGEEVIPRRTAVDASAGVTIQSAKSLIVDTQGSVNISVKSTHTIKPVSIPIMEAAYVKAFLRVYHNDTLIYSNNDPQGIASWYNNGNSSLNGQSHSHTSALIPISYIKKGDKITAAIELWYTSDSSCTVAWVKGEFDINVYAKTVIIKPDLFKVE